MFEAEKLKNKNTWSKVRIIVFLLHYLFNIAGPGSPGIRDYSISEHVWQAFYQIAANIQGRKGYHVATHDSFYFY